MTMTTLEELEDIELEIRQNEEQNEITEVEENRAMLLSELQDAVSQRAKLLPRIY